MLLSRRLACRSGRGSDVSDLCSACARGVWVNRRSDPTGVRLCLGCHQEPVTCRCGPFVSQYRDCFDEAVDSLFLEPDLITAR